VIRAETLVKKEEETLTTARLPINPSAVILKR
jgi:hypothetical protein